MKYIKAEKIEVGYSDRIIIEQLDIEIPIGKTTTIIGPNGCGKSTFLKALGRILDIKKGTILLEGKDIHKMGTKEIARQMAILPQSPIAPDGVTVEELVSYGRFPYQKGLGKLKMEDKKIIDWAIEATNLSGLKEAEVDNLSGGQRQRVWIAMALAQETDIILLDEPTTYLDMAYQLEVLELLDQLNKQYGCTIIMVLHDLNLAARFADHMVAFCDGEVVKAGNPNEVMTNQILRQVYQIDANVVIDPSCNRPICLSYELLKTKNKEKVKRGA
jgi:iron complex transport system ATP-binding protein